MTRDRSYRLVVTAIGTAAGKEVRTMRKQAGKAKKVLWAEEVGGQTTNTVTTELVVEAPVGTTTVTTASNIAGAETWTTAKKTTNGDQEPVDTTGMISPMASGATGMMMTVGRAIVTGEMSVTAGYGALTPIDIEGKTPDTARRAGTGRGSTGMIDRCWLMYRLPVLPSPIFCSRWVCDVAWNL